MLGGRLIRVSALPEIHATSASDDPYDWTQEEFALTRVCRQIFAETALLPYSMNRFSFHCRLERDNWAARLTSAQLQAVRTIEISNPYVFDAINGTQMGYCHYDCQGLACRNLAEGNSRSWFQNRPPASSWLMPFSVMFPNLRQIVVDAKFFDLATLKEMAQLAGTADWKTFMKLRERDDVEVVEI